MQKKVDISIFIRIHDKPARALLFKSGFKMYEKIISNDCLGQKIVLDMQIR